MQFLYVVLEINDDIILEEKDTEFLMLSLVH